MWVKIKVNASGVPGGGGAAHTDKKLAKRWREQFEKRSNIKDQQATNSKASYKQKQIRDNQIIK